MKRKLLIIVPVIIAVVASVAVYLKWTNDLSSSPVLYAISEDEARGRADAGEGYIVGCAYSTGLDYFIAYGEHEGMDIGLSGNTPVLALNRETFLHEGNRFLLKGELVQATQTGKYQMEIAVESWDIIAPIMRDYSDPYDTRSGKTRWFTPKDYFDDFDIQQGDFFMTSIHFPQPTSEAIILPPRKNVDNSELPLITYTENLLTYEKGVWPPFYQTPDAEPETHPFDGYAAFNAFCVDLNCDGIYETYATIHEGSGIVTTYLLGYDPVTKSTYKLNERMVADYGFFAFEGELFVRSSSYHPSYVGILGEEREGMSYGCYRPLLNTDTLTFDLEQIDEGLLGRISVAAADESDQKDDVEQQNTHSGDESFTVVPQSYDYTDADLDIEINVEYLQISGLDDTEKQERINAALYEIVDMFKYDEESELELTNYSESASVSYSIIGADIMSVQYATSYDHMMAAHPSAGMVTVTIDLRTGEKLRLSDILILNDDFPKILNAETADETRMEPQVLDFYEDVYNELHESIVEHYSEDGGYYYLTENSMGFILYVPHVVGDYWMFEIAYEDIADFLTPDFQSVLLSPI